MIRVLKKAGRPDLVLIPIQFVQIQIMCLLGRGCILIMPMDSLESEFPFEMQYVLGRPAPAAILDLL
ncbi:MAG: hypothetical protein D4R40_02630 [Nitrosomonadaceae bacterium]|nr:MAG: hypothetical protein D4R40_02630 [Nitrosomonadaceae bacterium]